jgi:hypothetical protein
MVNEACLLSNPSRHERSLCNAFRRLSVWSVGSQPPELPVPCWRTVATVYPLGNCDSSRLETRLNYLTRLGTVSHRSSSLSPFFAFTDSARTLPEELVNSASATLPFGFVLEGLSQPAWPSLSPVAWDYPRGLLPHSFVRFGSLGSFNEL